MTRTSFRELEADFLRITTATVFCTATTVDGRGLPRARPAAGAHAAPDLHRRDGRPLGWALTGRTPLKTRHLAANPHMSCAYWTPSHDTVVRRLRRRVGRGRRGEADGLGPFLDTPTPLGWGAEDMAGYGPERWRNPVFTPLRLEPWRVQVMLGEEYPGGDLAGRVWHAA